MLVADAALRRDIGFAAHRPRETHFYVTRQMREILSVTVRRGPRLHATFSCTRHLREREASIVAQIMGDFEMISLGDVSINKSRY